ncbi:MAG: dipeptide ABC transporter ATP-binding protein [Aestuariivirga sp.]|uniref:dipeptide ABC transporter ATP-binding protein n=1 Tax=Aestuariivirga sp. TaxID=2650926 RepID=UPI0038D150BD
MTALALEVDGLSVSYRQGLGWRQVVEDVSFSVRRGEVLGLVGESGCGKSTVALQLLGFRHGGLRTDAGRIMLDGLNVLGQDRAGLDRMRGARVSFVPQNPTTALNPGMRVGAQIDEILAAHDRPAGDRTRALFGLVGLPDDAAFLRRFPHQLSGGQQQRVCIAMALACEPGFVVLDEPTTGLDVTTQEQIVELLIDLRARLGMSMLYVTHDLGLLSQIADRIGVMYAGHMVEIAPTERLFAAPRHPYTRGLIAALPRIDGARRSVRPLRGLLQRDMLPKGCPFAPRCDYALPRCFEEVQSLSPAGQHHEVACWRLAELPPAAAPADTDLPAAPDHRSTLPLLSVDRLTVSYGRGSRAFTALDNVSLTVEKGETVALVGESGSGKSTLARAIAGMVAPAAGHIRLVQSELAALVKARSPAERRLIQYIFQNPDASLNPRATIGRSLTRPLEFFFPEREASTAEQVTAALAEVRLDAGYASRYPDQLSGGERQRVAIARALIAQPDLLLCDEVLSALDVSVQASILELLQRLKSELGVAMLFISHDLAVVRMLADRVCVLFRGQVMELGPREQVFAPPFHPYTLSLLEAVPSPLRKRKPVRQKTMGSGEPGPGCVYAGRCAVEIPGACRAAPPPWRETPGGLAIRCHHTLEDLQRKASPLAEKGLETP